MKKLKKQLRTTLSAIILLASASNAPISPERQSNIGVLQALCFEAQNQDPEYLIGCTATIAEIFADLPEGLNPDDIQYSEMVEYYRSRLLSTLRIPDDAIQGKTLPNFDPERVCFGIIKTLRRNLADAIEGRNLDPSESFASSLRVFHDFLRTFANNRKARDAFKYISSVIELTGNQLDEKGIPFGKQHLEIVGMIERYFENRTLTQLAYSSPYSSASAYTSTYLKEFPGLRVESWEQSVELASKASSSSSVLGLSSGRPLQLIDSSERRHTVGNDNDLINFLQLFCSEDIEIKEDNFASFDDRSLIDGYKLTMKIGDSKETRSLPSFIRGISSGTLTLGDEIYLGLPNGSSKKLKIYKKSS